MSYGTFDNKAEFARLEKSAKGIPDRWLREQVENALIGAILGTEDVVPYGINRDSPGYWRIVYDLICVTPEFDSNPEVSGWFISNGYLF